MVATKCFVPGCKSGYLSNTKKREAEGKRKLTLFKPPYKEDALQKWKDAVKEIAHRELTRKDKVCELHFSPKEICRYFVHHMPDGNTVFIPREKKWLVKDAVPSIFRNPSSNLSTNDRNTKTPLEGSLLSKNDKKRKPFLEKMSLSKNNKKMKLVARKSFSNSDKNRKPLTGKVLLLKYDKKRKPSLERTSLFKSDEHREQSLKRLPVSKIDKKRKPSLETMSLSNKINTEDTKMENVLNINEAVPSFTFEDLVKNLSKVCRPNKFWCVSSHEDFILCVKWDSKFAPERQIVVDDNLGIKLRYCGTDCPSVTVLDSVESLSQIIEHIDKREVCPGALRIKIAQFIWNVSMDMVDQKYGVLVAGQIFLEHTRPSFLI